MSVTRLAVGGTRQNRTLLPENGGDQVITMTVSCGVVGSRRRARHVVTVHEDWSVETVHDLESERIAAAFGAAEVTCLALADHDLPAVRDLLACRSRSVLPPMVHVAADVFVPVLRGRGCGCVRRTFSMGDCGEHVRLPLHWARAHGSRPAAMDRLLARAEDAGWATMRVPEQGVIARAESLLVGPDAVRLLWRVGIHPAEVIALHERLEPTERDGSPGLLRPRTVVGALLDGGLGGDWLDALRGLDPITIESHVRARGSREGLDPFELRRWAQAGADAGSASVLVRAGWRVEDLHRVSGRSVPSRFHCARVAAAWAEAGAAITVDEYVAIYGEAQVAHLSLPRKETVDAVRRHLGDLGSEVASVTIAYNLVRTGSVQGGVAAFRAAGAPVVGVFPVTSHER